MRADLNDLRSALYFVLCSVLGLCRSLQFFPVSISCLVAVRSKVRVYGRSLPGIAGSNPAGGGGDGFLSILKCCVFVR